MQRYVRFIVRHSVAVVVAVLIVTAILATQARHVHLEIRSRALQPQHHPYVQIHNHISELFGGETIAIAGVIANQGDIYTPELLGKIYRITEGLRRTPGVIEANLFSIAAPYVRAVVTGPDGSMEVRPLMETPPTTPEEIRVLRDAVRQDRLFRGNLVSADETAAGIVVDFDSQLNDVSIAQAFEKVLAPERDDRVTIALAGVPILRAWLSRYTGMIGVLFPIAVLVIGLVHYDAFRTIQAMLLPLATALLSVIWALGIMGLLGEPMDTWSAMTPVVILAVGAGHAVQILKRYYEEYALVGDNRQAVIRSLAAVGPVMLTAGLIASAGFASLMTFGITSVRVFGLLLASGILSALVIELTFTPACRCLLPPPKRRELRREEEVRWLDRLLEGLAGMVVGRPRTVLACTLLTALVALAGAAAIHVDNSFRLWFAPSTQVRKDDALLNEKLAGTATLRILVNGDHDDVLIEPRVLQAISDLERFMETDDQIGGVTSIADHVKRMHQAMNGGDPAFYSIPDNRRLIAQYLLLYGMATGPNGLSAFIDSTYRRAVIRALSKTDGAAFSRVLLERLRDYVAVHFRGLPVKVEIAGGALGVLTAMNEVVVREKTINGLQIGAIIFILSAIVLRSLVGAVFVLTPLAMAVLVTLGIMGWTRTWLDMSTATFTAMGVSIGADFAIYLIFRIREELDATGTMEEAIHRSLRTSGKAIFFVASAVALGYMVLPFSGFSVWIRLGVLTAIIISASALATLTVIPALALIIQPRFLSPRQDPYRSSP